MTEPLDSPEFVTLLGGPLCGDEMLIPAHASEFHDEQTAATYRVSPQASRLHQKTIFTLSTIPDAFFDLSHQS